MMMKSFGNWRINIHQNQVQLLKEKIRQFGPEIEDITRRQKTTFDEKIVLMNIIDSKEKTIKNYIKQLEQAEYKIRTKEEKYLKLKDFCQEHDDQHLYNTKLHQTTFLGESQIPDRDYDTLLKDDPDLMFSGFRHF